MDIERKIKQLFKRKKDYTIDHIHPNYCRHCQQGYKVEGEVDGKYYTYLSGCQSYDSEYSESNNPPSDWSGSGSEESEEEIYYEIKPKKDYSKYKVIELREILRGMGLSPYGKKEELIKRIERGF